MAHCYVGCYVALIVWFTQVDIYHHHSLNSALVLAHNSFRALFIFYLFCMVHGAPCASFVVSEGIQW